MDDTESPFLPGGVLERLVEHRPGVGVHRVHAHGDRRRSPVPTVPGVGHRDRPAVHATGHRDGDRPVRQAVQPGVPVVLEHQEVRRPAQLDQDRADRARVTRGHDVHPAFREPLGQCVGRVHVVDRPTVGIVDVHQLERGPRPVGLAQGIAQSRLAVVRLLDRHEDAGRWLSTHAAILPHAAVPGEGRRSSGDVAPGPAVAGRFGSRVSP